MTAPATILNVSGYRFVSLAGLPALRERLGAVMHFAENIFGSDANAAVALAGDDEELLRSVQ